MKMRYIWLLLAWQAGLAGAPLQLTPEERAAFDVKTAPVEEVSQSLSKTYPAKVSVPNAQLRVVGSPLDGVVEALLVAEGESVQQGQALARLRSKGLLELQAAYLESRTRRQLAGENLQRDRRLHAEGIIAERRLLDSRATHREAVTAEQRDHQALLLSGMPPAEVSRLERDGRLSAVMEVTAPLNGVVLEQIATAGQRLAAADPLYRIGDLQTLWVEVHVPIDALAGIREGGQVLLSGNLSAGVITVGRMVHGTDQGVLVRAEVTEGSETLRPGQFVEARLQQATSGPRLRVPARALLRIGDADQVIVERDGLFTPVPVEVMAREAQSVVVQGKLAAGEAVVVNGTAAIKAALSGQE